MTDQNLAFYFQNFTTTPSNGSIDYSTAGVIPSNSISNRVVAITISGTLFPQDTNQYTFVLDFTNVQSQRQINLEGPIDGVVTLCKKTFDISDLVTYTYGNRILILEMKVPRVIRKKSRHFFMNFQINDTGCTFYVCPVDLPPSGQYDFSVKTTSCGQDSGQYVRSYRNFGEQCGVIYFSPEQIVPGSPCPSSTTLILSVGDPIVNSYTFDISDLGTYTECEWSINTLATCTETVISCALVINWKDQNGNPQSYTVPTSSTGTSGSFPFYPTT